MDQRMENDVASGAGGSPDRIEIRMLGPLQVRLPDGLLVSNKGWRTGKTADLLRLLALANGQHVPVSSLLEALWPTVDEQRARASLRTAASHLRKVLGPDRVERGADALRLLDTWVDVGAFTQLAAEAARAHRAGRLAECVTATREAESLYVDDFRSHVDDAVWSDEWRTELAHDYITMLTDAAEASVELGWMRDAVEFATRVLDRDHCSERAYRALMQGCAGMGETERALRAFERCRALLADELGADPSPQTRAVHLQVLTQEPVTLSPPTWIGRAAEVHWLRDVLNGLVGTRRPVFVRLSGPAGIGRRRLAAEACRRAGVVATEVRSDDGAEGTLVEQITRIIGTPLLAEAGEPQTRAASAGPAALVVEAHELHAEGNRLAQLLRGAAAPVALIVLSDAAPQDDGLLESLDLAPGVLHELDLQPFSQDETATLAAAVLGADVVPRLAAELMSEAEGNPGRSLETLTAWSRSGRIAATAVGLVLTSPPDAQPAPEGLEPTLALVLDRLDDVELTVLSLVAVLDRPVSAAGLVPLLDEDVPTDDADREPRVAVQTALDHLVDLCVLMTAPGGLVFRDPVRRTGVTSWLRPAARRRLHARIAERAAIPVAERIEHWSAAGESELACAAALDAARLASAESRHAEAHDHLVQAGQLASADARPADRVDLHERMGDTCTALGRREEAREAYLLAVNVARVHGLDSHAALKHKLDATSDAPHPRRRASDIGGVAGAASSAPRPDWEARLEEIETVLLPQRDFEGARSAASLVSQRADDPAVRGRAALALHLPDLLLGDPRQALEPLHQATEDAQEAGAHEVARTLRLARCLGAHDAGLPSFGALWNADGLGQASTDELSWARLRILTERGELAAAAALEPALLGWAGLPLVRHLGLLTSAELRIARGQHEVAVDVLRSLLDDLLEQNAPLLVPKVAARLVGLVAPDDPTTAQDYFDLMDMATSNAGDLPRERAWRQIARAAVRASGGRPRAAAAAAGIGSQVASANGVLPLAARAEAARAVYLRGAGSLVEARLAAEESTRLQRLAGLSGAAEEPLAWGAMTVPAQRGLRFGGGRRGLAATSA